MKRAALFPLLFVFLAAACGGPAATPSDTALPSGTPAASATGDLPAPLIAIAQGAFRQLSNLTFAGLPDALTTATTNINARYADARATITSDGWSPDLGLVFTVAAPGGAAAHPELTAYLVGQAFALSFSSGVDDARFIFQDLAAGQVETFGLATEDIGAWIAANVNDIGSLVTRGHRLDDALRLANAALGTPTYAIKLTYHQEKDGSTLLWATIKADDTGTVDFATEVDKLLTASVTALSGTGLPVGSLHLDVPAAGRTYLWSGQALDQYAQHGTSFSDSLLAARRAAQPYCSQAPLHPIEDILRAADTGFYRVGFCDVTVTPLSNDPTAGSLFTLMVQGVSLNDAGALPVWQEIFRSHLQEVLAVAPDIQQVQIILYQGIPGSAHAIIKIATYTWNIVDVELFAAGRSDLSTFLAAAGATPASSAP